MHCFRCGEELPDNARFCSECGVEQVAEITPVVIAKPNLDNASATTGQEPPRQAIAPKSARRAVIVASIALQVLIYGGYRFFESSQGGASLCQGASAWRSATTSRLGTINAMSDQISSLNVSRADLQIYSKDLARFASEQRSSSPPPAAEILNSVLIEYYQVMSRNLEAIATGAMSAADRNTPETLKDRMEDLIIDFNDQCID